METLPVDELREPYPMRPVARWAPELDGAGRLRPAMTWSVPDPDTSVLALGAARA